MHAAGEAAYEPIEDGDEWLEEPAELPRRPRRRLLGPIPLALLGVLLVACGFIGGVLVEKGQGSSSSSGGAAAASPRASRPCAAAPRARARGSGAGRRLARRLRRGSARGAGATAGQVAYLAATRCT